MHWQNPLTQLQISCIICFSSYLIKRRVILGKLIRIFTDFVRKKQIQSGTLVASA